MNYFEKNKKNIFIAIIALFLLIALIALWLQQRNDHNSEEIIASVSPNTLTVGDSLVFQDKTPFAKTVKWDFGDGFNTDVSFGTHVYRKPGYYPVTVMVNNKFPKTFYVLVSNPTKRMDSVVVPTTIEAPTQAMQFSNITFRANSLNGKQFSWKFGETGGIDSKDKTASYSYKTPGDKVVILTTDDSNQPIIHHIRILPAYDELQDEPKPTITEAFNQIDDDFKFHLQKIANGENFSEHYNYLMRNYLCNKESAPVIVNDNKNINFYYYCTGLQFDKNNVINEVKTTFDNKQNCVIKVEVKQNKQ